MDKKALSLLGLANRARKITTGEELVLKAVRNGKAKMVLISEDISEKTEKTIRNKCEYYNVVVKKAGTREMIGVQSAKTHVQSLQYLIKDLLLN